MSQSLGNAVSSETPLAPSSPAIRESFFAGQNLKADELLQTVEENRRQLLWLAERITKDREEAEDILQDSIIKALRNLHTFRGDSKVGTWLRVIVQNTAREWLRRRGARIVLPLESSRLDEEDQSGVELTDLGPNPEEWYQRNELAEMVHTELARLTPFARCTLQMCAIEGRSLREASEALKLSVITVKSRIFRGKRLLRKRITRRLGDGGRAFLG